MALKFFWRCESTTFDPTHDFSAADTTPSINNSPEVSALAAKVGANGLLFNGSLERYEFNPASLLEPSQGAVGMWIQASSAILAGTGYQFFVCRGASFNDHISISLLSLVGNGRIRLTIRNSATGAIELTTSVANLTVGNWYGVIVRWNAATNLRRIEVYDSAMELIDSAESSDDFSANVPADFNNSGGLRIGENLGTTETVFLDNIFLADFDEAIEENLNIASYTEYTASGIVRTPAVGSLTLTGHTPRISLGEVRPGTGTLSFAGAAPLLGQFDRIPTGQELALTGYAPTLSLIGEIKPLNAALTLQGFAPSVIQVHSAQPGSASLSFTGLAPSIITPSTLRPATATLTLTGALAEQTLTLAAPGTAALSLSGIAPNIIRGIGRISASGVLTLTELTPRVSQQIIKRPGTDTLSITGAAPSFGGGIVLRPASASLSLVGLQPFVQGALTIQPGTGTLNLNGIAPVITGESIKRPGTASLAFAGVAPAIVRGVIIRPEAGSLSFVGLTPNVRVPIIIQPPAGRLRLSGQLAIGGGVGGGDGTDGGTGVILRRPARLSLRHPIRNPLRVFRA